MFAKKDEQPSDCRFFPGIAWRGQLGLQAGLLGIKVKMHCTKGADMANTRKGVNKTCQR